jgi:hypothetical protein
MAGGARERRPRCGHDAQEVSLFPVSVAGCLDAALEGSSPDETAHPAPGVILGGGDERSETDCGKIARFSKPLNSLVGPADSNLQPDRYERRDNPRHR